MCWEKINKQNIWYVAVERCWFLRSTAVYTKVCCFNYMMGWNIMSSCFFLTLWRLFAAPWSAERVVSWTVIFLARVLKLVCTCFKTSLPAFQLKGSKTILVNLSPPKTWPWFVGPVHKLYFWLKKTSERSLLAGVCKYCLNFYPECSGKWSNLNDTFFQTGSSTTK